ncbi:MAG: glycosyltransferase [Gammaproteobacteria bacterium]|nr:glycosyltransferase [Gammaproteobacteria bacterium]
MSSSKTPVDRLIQITSGDLWAGAEVQFFNLLLELRRLHYEIHVVLLNEGVLQKKLLEEGVSVTVIDEKSTSSFNICRKLICLFRSYKPNVIHTHGYKENILASFSNYLSVRCNCIRTVHGDTESSISFLRLDKLLTKWLNYFSGNILQDRIIVVSEPLAKKLEQEYRVTRISVIENSIDTERVVSESNLPIEYNYPEDCIKIAMAGRLVALKRHELIIQCMPAIREASRQKVVLYIYGAGPQRSNLKSLVEALHLEEEVVFMGDCIPLYPHIKQMDMLLMPSDHEGLPMIILEAMILEVPIIAHAVGSIPKLLDEGAFGILIREHEQCAYRDAIIEVLSDPASATNKALLGSRYINDNYGIQQQIYKYDEMYKSLTS